MTHLSDAALDRLRRVADWPELSGERFQVSELIGEGGMGRVYRVHDTELGRDVALKVLRPELAGGGDLADLEREARILARLEHPGIVPVHDVGLLGDGRVYYLMRLVQGTGLPVAVESLSLQARLRLFLRICETVAFAHANGVVHRDLKPGNIMIGGFGEVLVLDWGLATGPGSGAVAAGTPGFMAPEQALGDATDHRADIFALGAILRGLIAVGDQASPRPLLAIAGRASASAPGDRYATVVELAAEVTRYLDGGAVQAYRETLLERMARWYGNYRTAVLLILTYLIVRLLVAAWRGI